jgi:hypothetical protein
MTGLMFNLLRAAIAQRKTRANEDVSQPQFIIAKIKELEARFERY